jgi:hypothetical protein
VYPLHVTHGDDGNWYAIFETDTSFDEPECNIVAMLDAVESLSHEERSVWSRCDLREFNIGYDCGHKPWAFNHGLSARTLGRIAALAASLRWTLYPAEQSRTLESSADPVSNGDSSPPRNG